MKRKLRERQRNLLSVFLSSWRACPNWKQIVMMPALWLEDSRGNEYPGPVLDGIVVIFIANGLYTDDILLFSVGLFSGLFLFQYIQIRIDSLFLSYSKPMQRFLLPHILPHLNWLLTCDSLLFHEPTTKYQNHEKSYSHLIPPPPSACNALFYGECDIGIDKCKFRTGSGRSLSNYDIPCDAVSLLPTLPCK